jgi:hypothetical protein
MEIETKDTLYYNIFINVLLFYMFVVCLVIFNIWCIIGLIIFNCICIVCYVIYITYNLYCILFGSIKIDNTNKKKNDIFENCLECEECYIFDEWNHSN